MGISCQQEGIDILSKSLSGLNIKPVDTKLSSTRA